MTIKMNILPLWPCHCLYLQRCHPYFITIALPITLHWVISKQWDREASIPLYLYTPTIHFAHCCIIIIILLPHPYYPFSLSPKLTITMPSTIYTLPAIPTERNQIWLQITEIHEKVCLLWMKYSNTFININALCSFILPLSHKVQTDFNNATLTFSSLP